MDSATQAKAKAETLNKSAIADLLNVHRVTFKNWMRGTINIEGDRIPLHQYLLGLSYEDYRRIRIFSPKQVDKIKKHFGI